MKKIFKLEWFVFMILITAILYFEGCCSTCEKVTPPPKPNSQKVWSLHEKWEADPNRTKIGTICKGTEYEYYFYRQNNQRSGISPKVSNKTNVEASCRNNVLFIGKPKLFQSMMSKTFKNYFPSANSKKVKWEEVQTDILTYNKTNEQSGIYDCRPLGSDSESSNEWASCECILYGHYPKGELGLKEKLKEYVE